MTVRSNLVLAAVATMLVSGAAFANEAAKTTDATAPVKVEAKKEHHGKEHKGEVKKEEPAAK